MFSFAKAAYQPNHRSGQELIAHELTHVVQQAGGAALRDERLARQPLLGTRGLVLQRDDVPQPVSEVQIGPLLNIIQEQRQELSTLLRLPSLGMSEGDYLEQCWRQLGTLQMLLNEAEDPLAVWDSFIVWTETSIWQGGGQEYWELYPRDGRASQAEREPPHLLRTPI